MRTILLVVVVVSLIGGGCGSSGGGDEAAVTASVPETAESTAVGQPEGNAGATQHATVWEVADAVIATHGPDAGFEAVLYALDRGYSSEQIAAAGAAIAVDGSIAGVEPDHPPFGRVVPYEDEGTAWSPGLLLAIHHAAWILAADDDQVAPAEVKAAMLGDLGADEAKIKALAMIFAEMGLRDGLTAAHFDPTAQSPAVELDADQAKAIVGILILLVDIGYSFDDALVAALTEEWHAVVGVDETVDTASRSGFVDLGGHPATMCPVLRDSSGTVIEPTSPGPLTFAASKLCSWAIAAGTIYDPEEVGGSTEEPTAEAADDEPVAQEAPQPRIYRGEGLYRNTNYTSGDDLTIVCERYGDMELRLDLDGTATFTYFTGVGIRHTEGGGECDSIAGNAWTGTYDLAAGEFEIADPTDGANEVWNVGGTFDDTTAKGPAGYVYTTPFGDGFISTTIEIEFELPRVQ
jgi:hypothetical protein